MKELEVTQVIVRGADVALECPFCPTPVDQVVTRQSPAG